MCDIDLNFQVKLWIFFNEFWIVFWLGYGVLLFVLVKWGFGINIYIVLYNIIKVYVKLFYIYNDIYRSI